MTDTNDAVEAIKSIIDEAADRGFAASDLPPPRAFDVDDLHAKAEAALSHTNTSEGVPDTTHNAELVGELQQEADLCRNEGADDIAVLLDKAIAALRTPDSDLLREALEENAKLRADLKKHGEHEEMYSCEGCGAPLYTDDEYVGDDCHGCWATMTSNHPSSTGRPCYAYRVNKPSAENLARLSAAQKGGA